MMVQDSQDKGIYVSCERTHDERSRTGTLDVGSRYCPAKMDGFPGRRGVARLGYG